MIRILNATYELRLIQTPDGQIPSRKEYFEQFGKFLDVDFSKYHVNLSQALKNQSLEVNLEVFDRMKEITQNAHYSNN